MWEGSPREISYFWKDALQRTSFCGMNPVGYRAFKDGRFKDTILEGSDPLKPLEELKNSKELSDEEKAVVDGCVKVLEPLFDNPTYNTVNPFEVEYVELWHEVKKLNKMFGDDICLRGGCFNCTQRELEIEYVFNKDGVLKRMVTYVTPVDELKPRLWDPKFHKYFVAARDKQSPLTFDEFTLSDEEFVDELSDDDDSESTVDEIEGVANDPDVLAERDGMNVQDGAKAEKTNDGDEAAAELSDKFAPLTLIGTDEKTQE
ncbi:hypothetical protein EAE96_009547 [Botrytis aclada]|nr:hypothetical protein EAE96_009547 [Botrytis aclada]